MLLPRICANLVPWPVRGRLSSDRLTQGAVTQTVMHAVVMKHAAHVPDGSRVSYTKHVRAASNSVLNATTVSTMTRSQVYLTSAHLAMLASSVAKVAAEAVPVEQLHPAWRRAWYEAGLQVTA